MHKNSEFIWYNGKIVKWQDANLHILNYGLHYGCAAFEGLRFIGHKIAKLKAHIARFRSSCQVLSLVISYTDQELIDAIYTLIELNNFTEGYIRPVAWFDSETLALAAPTKIPMVAIAMWQSSGKNYEQKRHQGVDLTIAEARKAPNNSFPNGHKLSAGYMMNALIKNQAQAAGFFDALILDQKGAITEATTTNFFIIRDGVVLTPTPGDYLAGLTRQLVLEQCVELGIEAHEVEITPHDLIANPPDAAFLTGTAVEILPIRSITIEGKKLQLDIAHPLYHTILNSRSNWYI